MVKRSFWLLEKRGLMKAEASSLERGLEKWRFQHFCPEFWSVNLPGNLEPRPMQESVLFRSHPEVLFFICFFVFLFYESVYVGRLRVPATWSVPVALTSPRLASS